MNDDKKDDSIRLNRYLAQCGLGSRRACDEIVARGHIYKNGNKVIAPGIQVSPVDRIEYMGKVLRPLHRHEYLAYYKPREVMVTALDPEGRVTVYDALSTGSGRDVSHLKYVGRLDYQSEGLLLLTNDGDLIHALTHPRFHIKKVYHVKLERCCTGEEIAALVDGVESEGQLLHAGSVKQLSHDEADRKQYWYEIELFEGKNRQIRRMFQALDILVGRIRRIQFGCVALGGMTSGDFRPLTEKEIAGLRNTGYKVPQKGQVHSASVSCNQRKNR